MTIYEKPSRSGILSMPADDDSDPILPWRCWAWQCTNDPTEVVIEKQIKRMLCAKHYRRYLKTRRLPKRKDMMGNNGG